MFKENIDLLLKSCITYYNYIKSEGKSKSRIGITKIAVRKDYIDSLYLYLDSPLYSPDDVTFVYISGKTVLPVKPSEYRIFGYDDKKKILGIKPTSKESIFFKVNKNYIFIESDLSFIVKRYLDFYSDPETVITIEEPIRAKLDISDLYFSQSLSDEQKKAVFTALLKPISYIWGAPGTGKTSKVLADCLMNYIRQDMTTLILAPTNNALDQSLRGILDTIKNNGIPTTCVRRYGIPTQSFRSEYPEVCDSSILLKKINETENSIQTIEQLIDKRESIRSETASLYKFLESFSDAYTAYSDLLGKYEKYKKEYSETEKESDEFNLKLAKEYAKMCSVKSTYNDYLKEYNSVSVKFSMFFSKTKRQRYNGTLDNIKNELSTVSEKYSELQAEKSEIDSKLKFFQKKCEDVNREKIFSESNLKKIIIDKYSNVPFELITALIDEDIKQLYIKEQDLIQNRNLEEEKIVLEEKLAELFRQKESEDENVHIYALTVDSFVSRKNDFKNVNHVFLDEAAYCPLPKCGPLFFGVPITFLGDHMQLPPICEATQTFIDNNKEVVLWEFSSLYFCKMFSSIVDISDFYHFNMSLKTSKDTVVFPDKECSVLSRSFRFGNNLASILAHNIYSNEFIGCSENTELLYIDYKSDLQCNQNENAVEAELISEYLKYNNLSDFAILTPYRSQRKLLRRLIPNYSENIMTIHASQGREFDTVIISPVRLSIMTNSKILSGKQTINTAISRAKKRIILVCNSDYWKSKEDQLIAQVLEASTPVNIIPTRIDE